MDTRQKNSFILAIKKCISSTFDFSHWKELSYVTKGEDIIYTHDRLLRSLSFNDDDYDGNVLEVVAALIEKDEANLDLIIDHLSLPEWLKENSSKDFEKLYGHAYHLLGSTEKQAIKSSFDVNRHIARIHHAIDVDPELAIGSTKELLESVLKTILISHGESTEKDDLQQLLKKTQKVLKLDPKEVDTDAKGTEIIKRTLSNLGQVIVGIDELRNLYGTGHGRAKKSGVTARHAKLVVGAGATLATFLMETFEYHNEKDEK